MENIIDPCNGASMICSCIVTLIAVVGTHMFFSEDPRKCLPTIDYVKFSVICILMYFYYQIVIKMEKPLCGNAGGSMWSSICMCMLISAGALFAMCYKFKQIGEIIGYFLLVFGFLPCTLCCMFRMYKTGGPLNGDFWNPSTITKVYM